MIRALALAACLLTVCITAASAFIRHWQVGEGCAGPAPCVSVRSSTGASGGPAAARPPQANGDGWTPAATPRAVPTPLPIVIARAAHRLAAMIVGVLAILLVAIGWSRLARGERIAAGLALALTLGLAWLGLYTPSPLPLVTLANVGGGFALAAAFAWIAVGGRDSSPVAQRGARSRGSGLAWIGLALLLLVAAMGVMISERGALETCRAPLCLPGAMPSAGVFDPRVEGPAADVAAGQALHLAHRALAVAFAAIVALAAASALASANRWGLLLAAGVIAQALAGAAIAAGSAGAVMAAGHNAGAALLAAALAVFARRGGVSGGRLR